MPVVVNCTKCQKKLKIPDELLGKKVKCPTCSAVFTAEASEAVEEDRPAPKPAVKKPPVEDEDDDVPAPKAKRKPVDDDDDEGVSAKPSKRKTADDDEDEDEPPKKTSKRKVDDDDDEDEAPRKKSKRRDDDDDDDDDRPKRRRGGALKPHHGVIILICAIVGYFCPIVPAAIAVVWGTIDIKAMDNGEMDPSGRTLTNVGRILGIVFLILNVLGIIYQIVAGGSNRF
jgi:hypothetical protein